MAKITKSQKTVKRLTEYVMKKYPNAVMNEFKMNDFYKCITHIEFKLEFGDEVTIKMHERSEVDNFYFSIDIDDI